MGGRKLRLADVERSSPLRGRRYVFHHFLDVGGDGPTTELCSVDAEGQRRALPFADERGRVYLACTAGAIGKCARFGYWPEHPATVELHEACVRMVRADYGGDGASATRNGTRIEFCDRLGIFPCPDVDRPLEAAWSREGAVCVARPRYLEIASLEQLGARYPRLQGRLGEAACTLALVRDDPRVVLFGFAPSPRAD